MGKYTRTMAESLSMVSEVTNMDLMRKAAGGAMQTLKMKDGKVQMDSFTASAIMKIYDKVNDKNKKTMENMLIFCKLFIICLKFVIKYNIFVNYYNRENKPLKINFRFP